MTGELKKADKKFQKYLRSRILNSHLAQSMDGKSTLIIRSLVKAFLSNPPQQLPDKTLEHVYSEFLGDEFDKKYEFKSQASINGSLRQEVHRDFIKNSNFKIILLRVICDHIAGMTDRYALDQYDLLYGTKYERSF